MHPRLLWGVLICLIVASHQQYECSDKTTVHVALLRGCQGVSQYQCKLNTALTLTYERRLRVQVRRGGWRDAVLAVIAARLGGSDDQLKVLDADGAELRGYDELCSEHRVEGPVEVLVVRTGRGNDSSRSGEGLVPPDQKARVKTLRKESFHATGRGLTFAQGETTPLPPSLCS